MLDSRPSDITESKITFDVCGCGATSLMSTELGDSVDAEVSDVLVIIACTGTNMACQHALRAGSAVLHSS
jgi:hypothetical protein